MMLQWFNAREAADVGIALADQFARGAAARPATASTKVGQKQQTTPLQELLRRVDSDVRTLQLNFYKKAKFANSFKWRLIENGIEPKVADEVTQSLILHLSQDVARTAADRKLEAVPVERADSGKIEHLLAQAQKSFADGANADAVALYENFLELVPQQADALNNLGAALCALGRLQEAEQRYREAIDVKPDFPLAHCNLATLLEGKGQSVEAEQWLRRALKVNPKFADARARLGLILTSAGRLREATAAFKKVLKIEPRHAEALLGLGQIARMEGRFDEAESFVRRALKIAPKMPNAWAALQGVRKMTPADGEWLKGAEEIAGSGISLWEEASLRFAIGKYNDDVGDFARAFENYRRGNELLKTVAPKYNREAHSRFADDMIRGHTQAALATLGDGGSPSMKPVIVLGMPRSGTSLTEQIIASHPAAKGAGELQFWLNAARAHAELRQGIVGEPARKKLAEEYLRVLAAHGPDALRVVDKTPTNSDYLGFIHSVFPNARIIRMRRDPIDTCLSCYFQQFSTAQTFTMDLADLAYYYKMHQRLMKHWCAALPAGSILEVPYEELVVDQETWTRKILNFLELEWDERCLSFHETKRSVMTASTWQVRQKIYNRSVRRWRNYEKFIGPLKELRE